MSRAAAMSGLLLALGWMPAGAASAPAAGALVEHRVEPGDTLVGLLQSGADWRPVARANRVADPRRLRPGQVLRLPEALLREQPVQAEVVHAWGDVVVLRGGVARPLAGGDTVAAGDELRSGAQSSATLRFADGARLLLRPDSTLRIERLTQSRAGASSRVGLTRGSADSQVPPPPSAASGTAARRYQVITPHVNLGVRGTEFRTRVDADASTRLEVLDGRVGARQGARDEPVDAGFGLRADAQSLATAALPSAPRLDGLPARIERLPLRLTWQATEPAGTRMRAQLFTPGDPPRLLLDGVFDAGSVRWAEDLPDGPYELRVRTLGAAALEGRDAVAPLTLKARPEPPFVAAPADGARTTDEAPRLAWTRNAAAARVRLQVADTPDFAAPRIDRSDLDAAETRVALPLGTHHWRLASIRDAGAAGPDQGPFGDAQRLVRIAPPPAPEPVPPEAGADGLLLRWQSGVAAGTRWRVQVAREPTFGAPLLRDETVSEPRLLLPDPAPGRYYLRVKAIDADGFEGPFGQPQQADVPRSRWWWLLAPAAVLLLL